MKELHELLDLCLEKGLNFDLFPKIELIHVYKVINDKYTFNYKSYYDGNLKDYTRYYSYLTLSDLIQKVKEYELK